MTRFGDTWQQQELRFWRQMWHNHIGTEGTERLLSLALESQRVIEVGSGAGFFEQELRRRGYDGAFTGFEFSDAAVTHARRHAHPRTTFIEGDFMAYAARGPTVVRQGVLLVSQGVIQHQIHWLLMVLAMERFAAGGVVIGGYVAPPDADRHLGGWKEGHYDFRLCAPLMVRELAAVGHNDVQVELIFNHKRRCDEVLVTWPGEH